MVQCEWQRVIVREGEAWSVEIVGDVLLVRDATGAERARVRGLMQAGLHLAAALAQADQLQRRRDDREAVTDGKTD